ncbi:hypothetical protein EES37_37800 [Streptomyces sp. ADI91-18]|uniref:AbiTii domain-containing protein n=1 Tax=Streptomyces sp. ADI91-18 TaxID=1522755 RepID=UPI000F554117|nr:hypothetical protein [Streptomyces sp. ADI91-18]RPK23513.1 hypothetical protein EES37_37800 [Streptomyces sp. ADI91-18]
MIWPRRRELQPLDRLEQGVLDDTTQLAGLLRHALIIGGHASSQPLRQWALYELNGYANIDAQIPEYRRLPAPIRMDSLSPAWQRRGEAISVRHLPDVARDVIKEEVSIPWGVGHIENLIARTPPGEALKLALPGAAELRTLMSAQYRQQGISIEALYWSIDASALHGVVDQVRTRLTQFVAELRSAMPAGARVPSPEQVHRAVQSISIVTGDNSPVTITAPVAYAESGGTADARATPEPKT